MNFRMPAVNDSHSHAFSATFGAVKKEKAVNLKVNNEIGFVK